MKNSLETRLGIFFALALVVAFILMEVVGGLDFFKGGYRVHALFHTVQDLKVGNPVKLAGVRVGQVERIILTNDQVRVSMKLDKNTQIRTDSTATIKFAGLMGENFVSLDFGTPKGVKAEADAYLPTAEQADLGVIMAKLENVATGVENITKSFSGDNISNLLGPFTDFLKQNSPKLTALFGNMETISSQLANGKGSIGKMINDDTLYVTALNAVTNLQDAGLEIKTTIAQARLAVDQLNSGQGSLGKLMKDEKLYAETTEAMTTLKEILKKINNGTGSVGQLVNDDSLLKNAKMSLQKLDKAAEGLEDTGPLSVLGTIIGKVF